MESRKSAEVHTMNGGDGLYRYSKNSYQRTVSDVAKLYVRRAIASLTWAVPLDPTLSMWCKTNIIDSVKLKYKGQGMDPLESQALEFQVLFNDHASNDFNTLFKSLPVDKQFHIAGVPGSFYARLFPRESLHVVHSSFAAWNKGRIHYSDASDDVVRAYSDQSAMDMENFLNAKAQEVVHVPHSQAVANVVFEVLHGNLLDGMAKEVSELASEGFFKEHFEDEIIEELFELFSKKLEGGASSLLASGKSVNIFALLKRNYH